MANRVQLSAILISFLLSDVISVTIFQGLSIKKGIDISLVPFPMQPIAFIKEKWTPFGIFGIKHWIARRQVIDGIEPGVVVTPLPVVPPYIIQPVPRPEVVPLAPVIERNAEVPLENIDHVPPEVPLITPPVAPVEHAVSEIPIVVEEPAAPVVLEAAIAPAEAPPVIITPIPHDPIQATPIGSLFPQPIPTNLNTDISRTPLINDYLNSVQTQAPVVPTVKEVKEPESPLLFGLFSREGLRNGSKLAIQLGSAFLHYMTQLFNSPRSPLARFAES